MKLFSNNAPTPNSSSIIFIVFIFFILFILGYYVLQTTYELKTQLSELELLKSKLEAEIDFLVEFNRLLLETDTEQILTHSFSRQDIIVCFFVLFTCMALGYNYYTYSLTEKLINLMSSSQESTSIEVNSILKEHSDIRTEISVDHIKSALRVLNEQLSDVNAKILACENKLNLLALGFNTDTQVLAETVFNSGNV